MIHLPCLLHTPSSLHLVLSAPTPSLIPCQRLLRQWGIRRGDIFAYPCNAASTLSTTKLCVIGNTLWRHGPNWRLAPVWQASLENYVFLNVPNLVVFIRKTNSIQDLSVVLLKQLLTLVKLNKVIFYSCQSASGKHWMKLESFYWSLKTEERRRHGHICPELCAVTGPC